jgi:glycosyltransferase involved in cell wall biosynthesis
MIQTQAENAGAQQISRILGAGLAAHGHRVSHLFFYSRTGVADDLVDAEVIAAERPSHLLAFLRFLVATRRRIAEIRPDVVVTFQHWGNVLGAPLARAAGVPVVIANQVSQIDVNGPVPRAIDRLFGSIGVYDRNVLNSADTARLFARYPARYRARLVTIPHGFERKRSTLDRAAARARFDLPGEAPLLGCAARLNPSKRLDTAIRLLRRLGAHHLALAGQGPDHDRLVAVAAELGVGDRVHFVGELQPNRVGDFLAALDVFVFPTAAETFGLAGVEAAQAGLPVIAADLPVLREVLEVDGEPAALFVDPTDTTAFAAAIDRLASEPGLAERLRRAGTALDRRWSLDAMIDAYDRLIGETTLRGRTA